MNTNKKFQLSPYLYISPLTAVMLMILGYPFIYSICLGFTDYSMMQTEQSFVFLDNYIHIVTASYFWSTLGNTFLYAAVDVILITLLGLATAMLLNTHFWGSTLLKGVLLLPWIMPEVVTGYTWKWMLTSGYGIINNMLSKVGIITNDFSWFSTGSMAFCAVIIASVWRGFPFIAMMVYARLQTLPKEQLEAARIEGANSMEVFIYITTAHIKPILERCILLAFVWTFNSFSIIYTMTNGGPFDQTQTFPLLIQKTAFSYYRIGESAAMSVLMLVVILSVLLLGRMILLNKKRVE